jgi:voltage-gated potassium channel
MPIPGEVPTGNVSTAREQAQVRAERLAAWLRAPLIVAALLAVPVLVVQESGLGGFWGAVAAALDWCIWGVFAVNVVAMVTVVPDRLRWLRANPLDVLIVVLAPPFLPATMKIARALPLVRLVWLLVLANRLHNLFSVEGLRYAALIVFTVVVGGGTLFVAAEPAQQLTIWDGLWWSTETVTTVAYGDIYPTTGLGRLIAAVVMTTGVGFLALLTGSLAQRFVRGASDAATPKPTPGETETLRRLGEMSDQIARLQAALERRD